MTPEDFVKLIFERVTIRHPPFPFRLSAMIVSHVSRVAAYEVGSVVFYILTEVKDRSSGKRLPINFEHVIGGIELSHWDEMHAIDFIRLQLHQVATHEMDECLHIDGVRAFDPHEPPKFMKVELSLSDVQPSNSGAKDAGEPTR